MKNITVSVPLPSISNKFWQKELDGYASARLTRLENELKSLATACSADIAAFAGEMAHVVEVDAYLCTWIEDYGNNDYGSKSQVCERYFLREFQAQAFKDQNRCTGQCVGVYYDKRDFGYYKIDYQNGAPVKTKIWMELSNEDKMHQKKEREIAYHQRQLEEMTGSRPHVKSLEETIGGATSQLRGDIIGIRGETGFVSK